MREPSDHLSAEGFLDQIADLESIEPGVYARTAPAVLILAAVLEELQKPPEDFSLMGLYALLVVWQRCDERAQRILIEGTRQAAVRLEERGDARSGFVGELADLLSRYRGHPRIPCAQS